MMRSGVLPGTFSSALALGIGILISLHITAPAARSQLAVEPYLGAYWFDDDALDFGVQEAEFDAGPILGARVLFSLGEGWSIGGGYGYGSFTVTFRVPTVEDPIAGISVEEEVTEQLYYGTVEYAAVRPDPVGFHLSGELGGATYSPDEEGSTSDFLAGFGAGLGFRTSEHSAIHLDARDHLRFCSRAVLDPPRIEENGLCEEDEVLHNLELSAGVRIRF